MSAIESPSAGPAPALRDYRMLGVIACIAAGAMALRLTRLDASLWIDEISTLQQAQAADFLAAARDYDHPPLYFLLIRCGLHFSESIPALRFLSVLAGVTTVVLGGLFFGRPLLAAGWRAGLLLACLPGLVANAQELRQYALLSALLIAALLSVWRLENDPRDHRAMALLAGLLVAAVATHLAAIFFIVALATSQLLRAWHANWQRIPVLIAAYAPAVALFGVLRYFFLSGTSHTAENWWMPPLSYPLLVDVFGEISGWAQLTWLADAAGRHLPGASVLLLSLAIVGGAFVLVVGWFRSSAAVYRLLTVALVYWVLVIGYSVVALPMIWPRILLPGMLPCVLSLALGIAIHPVKWRRHLATTLLVLAVTGMTVVWLRSGAFRPIEDLRGFGQATRGALRAEDTLLVLSPTDSALRYYWPEFQKVEPLVLDRGSPSLLSDALNALEAVPPGTGLLFTYRQDLSASGSLAGQMKKLLDAIAARHGPALVVWDKDGYRVLHFARR